MVKFSTLICWFYTIWKIFTTPNLILFQEKELKRQQAYEEFLKEKLMIDEIVRKIYEEDQR